MAKKNLNKKIMVALQQAGEEGIIPFNFSRRNHLDLSEDEKVMGIISKWENEGKVVCIKEHDPCYYGCYMLEQYKPIEHIRR